MNNLYTRIVLLIVFVFGYKISLKCQQFTEITTAAGITYHGTSFGQAWHDVDKDGFEDFVLTNHGYPYLYKNNGNGTFQEIPIDFFKGIDTLNGHTYPIRYDLHGAGFGDINGDGYGDLYFPIGGDNGNSSGKRNVLFINNSGNLVIENKAWEYGIHDSIGRGRSPLWFDQNGDGLIDLFLSNLDRDDNKFKSSLYVQNVGTNNFSKYMSLYLRESSLYFTTLMYHNYSKENVMPAVSEENDLLDIYDFSNIPFKVKLHKSIPSIRDVAIGDFNGDGMQDVFAASGKWGSEAVATDEHNMRVFLKTSKTNENMVRFSCADSVTFKCHVFPYKEDENTHIFYGKNKLNPTNLELTLHKDDPNTWGNNFTCNLCVPGLYIWFDTLTQKWGMVNKDPTNKASSATILYSNGTISNIETVKFTNTSLLTACKILYQNASGGFTVNSTFMKTGSPNKANCVSVVTADFDNDMDLDLLLSCQGQVVNYINKYYVNDGTGKFTNVTNFGAEGSLTGRSGGITYGDIDNDGFLDVLLENGEGQIGEFGEALHFNDGPTQLFRNNGNANHWIELELTSDVSNSLAVGALVYCYSGGKKQLRLKGSETHCFAQSSQRIHFGLGENALIDSLQIIWPNGADSVYYNIVPDQILAIHQSTETAPSRKSAVTQPKMLPISLYPNPTHNRLLIESKGYELGTFGVEIYDMSGNKVFENRQVTEREIPFEAYANGMYLVRIILADGNEYLYKIIKQ